MNSLKKPTLIFVYNANSGLGNALMDTAHKVLSPNSYACNLCGITYGLLTENRQWKKYRESSGIEMQFLHKDEFKKEYASKFMFQLNFPVVLAIVGMELEILIGSEELNTLKSTQELIALVEERTASYLQE